MTRSEITKAIKSELKAAGFDTKKISVRTSACGYSTSIDVKIKDPTINRIEVEKVIKHHEYIRYDYASYDILEGCNDFLFVEYQPGIFDEVAQEWAATAMGAMRSTDEITRICDGLYLINWEHSGRLELRQQNEKDFCSRYVYDFHQLCIYIYKFAKFGTIAA